MRGAQAGRFALGRVASAGGGEINLSQPLPAGFSADTALVQRALYARSIVMNGSMSPAGFDGTRTGGVVVLAADEGITISGDLSASGRGYLGGASVTENSAPGTHGGEAGGGSLFGPRTQNADNRAAAAGEGTRTPATSTVPAAAAAATVRPGARVWASAPATPACHKVTV